MALLSYKEWLAKLGESSPLTRWRNGWAQGLYPPRADVMSHSTPSAAVVKKAEKELGKPKKKKKKK